MTVVTKRKLGALSSDEWSAIKRMAADGKSLEEVAIALNRKVDPIRRYALQNDIVFKEVSFDEQDTMLMTNRLKTRPYWKEMGHHFDKDELDYFLQAWIHLMKQFRDDVLYSEELQIKQLITTEILTNRSMRDRKAHIEQVERLQKQLREEYKIPVNLRDVNKITLLEEQISFARNSISSYTAEYTKLLDKTQQINKDLKATREQRIKRVEDAKSSWTGYLREMEDERLRAEEGDTAEILKMATDKAFEKLSEWHQYADDKLDQPILTPENARVD
jgi:hypothetical protein